MTSTPCTRLAHRLAFAAAVATLAAPAVAGAGTSASNPAPDWFERAAAGHPYGGGALAGAAVAPGDGRSPDTRDAAAAAGTLDGRAPDTLDAASDAKQQLPVRADGRSPDTIDATLAPRPLDLASGAGLNWGDAGIGAGFTVGLLVLLAGTSALWVRRHPRRRVPAT
jgi:hypothetical protein